MKRLSAVFAVLMLMINLLIVHPAFADPIAEKSPEYFEITQTLNALLQAQNNPELAGYTAEQLQQKVSELQLQKYVMESTEDWGVCSNQTGRTIGIYAHKPRKPYNVYTSTLYYLAPGQSTDTDWDCDGVYLPNDVKVAGLDLGGAGAVKIVDGTNLVISANPFTNELALNAPLGSVVKAGENNWLIPNVTQADISAQFPNAPTD